jgi:hypothetical protein
VGHVRHSERAADSTHGYGINFDAKKMTTGGGSSNFGPKPGHQGGAGRVHVRNGVVHERDNRSVPCRADRATARPGTRSAEHPDKCGEERPIVDARSSALYPAQGEVSLFGSASRLIGTAVITRAGDLDGMVPGDEYSLQ